MRVGKHIAATAGYKRIVLELGGNDPLIVMEDADLDKAAELAVTGATKNSGQRCTAVKRILVVEKVADEFSKLVLEKAKKLKAGDPMDPATDVGTVIHEGAAKSFERRVDRRGGEGRRRSCTATTGRARSIRRRWSTTCLMIANWCTRRPSVPVIPIIRVPERHRAR